MFQMMKPDGTLLPDAKPPLNDQETFNLYQKMLFIRLADQRALMLQRQGRMGTYAPIWGQGGLPGRELVLCFKKGIGSFLHLEN